jgi:hypothetical protein
LALALAALFCALELALACALLFVPAVPACDGLELAKSASYSELPRRESKHTIIRGRGESGKRRVARGG